MDEIGEITDYIQDEAGATADVIWGHGYDESLGEGICVTLIATGFNSSPITGFEKAPEKIKVNLEAEAPQAISKPIETPTQSNSWNTPVAKVEEPKAEVKEVEEPFLKVPDETIPAEQTEINWTFTSDAVQSNKVEETPKAFEPKAEEVVRHYLTDDLEEKVEMLEVKPKAILPQEEQLARAKERMERIQAYTSKLKSLSGISDLEKEPAYKRKNIQIDDLPHSSEEAMSKFTLSNGNDGEYGGLRDNNSFLHDNVY